MKKVLSNYTFNLINNILNLLLPLVTTPYISRTVGAEGLGIYSYCYSIAIYFIITGTLGIPLYAKREISLIRDEKQRLDRLFSELLTIQTTLLTVSLVLYLVTAVIIGKYFYMFLASGVSIVAAMFEVSWFLAGQEEFRGIATRNIFIKLLSAASLFIFVKGKEDLYIYCLCLMLANLIGNFAVFVHVLKRVRLIRPRFHALKRHIKPAFILLLPDLVIKIQAVLDKTMLGSLAINMAEVGYYEQSQKVVTLSMAMITSLGTVLLPRFAALFHSRDGYELRQHVNKAVSAASFIALPLCVGCVVISNNLIPWFYGEGYEKIATLLKIFAPMLFFMGMGDLVGTQIFVATERELELCRINLLCTGINIVGNLLLIPKWQCYGAALSTVVSEAVKCTIFFIRGREYIDYSRFGKTLAKYAAAAIVMGVIVKAAEHFFLPTSSMLHTLLTVAIGGCVYGGILLCIKDEFIGFALSAVRTLAKKALPGGKNP